MTTKPAPAKLILAGIIRREEKHCLLQDERRRVNYVLASYRGDDGYEYRKSFSSYGEPVVPQEGTHAALNKLEVQF